MNSWDDLATTALLGTARRRPGDLVLPGGLAPAAELVLAAQPAGTADHPDLDPAQRLLDLAALATVYRRAGFRGAPARPRPEPAGRDERRPAGPAASARLLGLLGPADRDLLEIWLRAALERGVRPPDRALPVLLGLAARTPDLAGLVLQVVGPRGSWLAARRPDWVPLLRAAPEARDEALPDTSRRTWEVGTAAQRPAWLAAFRRQDPDAARELLVAGWQRESPADRAALLGALAVGLAPADEPFLERCLDDRRGDVRGAAAGLLTRLPGSGLARRAADRARAAVDVRRDLLRHRIRVQLPSGRDAAMARDQIPPPPSQLGGTGRGVAPGGPGAWLLLHVVAAAPLRTWVPDLAASPAALLRLGGADAWRDVLWFGWARATLRERDAGWAAALLAALPQTPVPASGAPLAAPLPAMDPAGVVTALLDLLAPADRAACVVGLLAGQGDVPLAALVRAVPGPWPAPVADALLARLRDRARLDDPQGRAVLDLAARRLATDDAPALRELADGWPPQSASRRVAAVAAELMTVRRAILEELQ